VFLDQTRRLFHIISRYRVIYCPGDESVLLVPFAGPAMESGNRAGLLSLQAVTQQVGKPMVIALPTSFVVQGYDE